ncbi:MAG: 5-formyltetrahydrofolate cyclo-ligase [Clostridiales bacterium]|nr:5-formyltetrahydrofolate cyclo-ligase [Clostridiales bacterium]
MDVSSEKSELRKLIRAKRRMLTEEERAASARLIALNLLELEPVRSAACVLAYMPMKYELDILPAVDELKARGIKAAFPLCVEEGGLRLFVPAEENGFKPGAYGILEPDESTAEEVYPEDIDVILLPAVGFDRHGNRLGQGGGYYDRLLKRSSCYKIAVGFDCQLVDRVPTEETDMQVDAVVTPNEAIVLR